MPQLSPPDLRSAWITALSHARFQTYINASGGDEERALRLYRWNSRMAAAWMPDLSLIEVALRNAIHDSLSYGTGHADWWNYLVLDNKTERSIDETITKLRGPARGITFDLYVIIDIYSRFVVGWTIAVTETGELAKAFIADTTTRHRIVAGQLALHADRGTSMTSKPVAQLLVDLGVEHSHSRPRVSNDNPYSEAAFKTLKYCPAFPTMFGSIEDARMFCQEFFDYYNYEHHHSGIGLLTPATIHHGQTDTVIAARNATLTAAFHACPNRFNKPPTAPTPPQKAWINNPSREALIRHS